MESAIRNAEAVLAAITDEKHSRFAPTANQLAILYGECFDRTGETSFLTKAIFIAESAVKATSDDHPDRALYLSTLGGAYGKMSARVDGPELLEKAINTTQWALSCLPKTSPNYRATCLHNLGTFQYNRFCRTGNERDLEMAILNADELIGIASSDDPQRPIYLNSIALMLRMRFFKMGDIKDIDQSISFLKQAINSTPRGYVHQAKFLGNMSITLEEKYRRTKDIGMLEEALKISKQLLSPACPPYEEAKRCERYGKLLLTLFEHKGESKDLDEAVRYARKAVSIIPKGDSYVKCCHETLARALFRRYKNGFAMCDLDDAIANMRTAITLAPEDYGFKSILTQTLNIMLAAKSTAGPRLVRTEGTVRQGKQANATTAAGRDLGTPNSRLSMSFSNRAAQSGHLNDALESKEQIIGGLGNSIDKISKPGTLQALTRKFSAKMKLRSNPQTQKQPVKENSSTLVNNPQALTGPKSNVQYPTLGRDTLTDMGISLDGLSQGDSVYLAVDPKTGKPTLWISRTSASYAFQHGLGSDHLDRQLSTPATFHVRPEDRNIIRATITGFCKFCQLLLSAQPPRNVQHHSSFAELKRSTERCEMCRELMKSFESRLESLSEFTRSKENSEILAMTMTDDRGFRIVTPTCGTKNGALATGANIVIAEKSKLGGLDNRAIWRSTESPGSKERLSTLSGWLEDCKSHPNCNPIQFSPPSLPTRVLDVGPSDGSKEVRLYASKGDKAFYVALSHCWGNRKLIMTERDTLEEFQKSIPFSRLSKTFQEAVNITRYLNLRYLWVDSLGIVQDDQDDWEREAARMAAVYENSFLTLAASAASDGNGGCLQPLTPTSQISAYSRNLLVRPESHRDLERLGTIGYTAPLNQRGWTFQEALLSPRIVHFCRDQMLWKCVSRNNSEDGLLDTTTPSLQSEGLLSMQQIQSLELSVSELYRKWHHIIQNYSWRKLKYSKDKLAALAGVITAYQKLTRDVPLLGLWKSNLPSDLLWSSHGFQPRTDLELGVPSWSWAAGNGPVYYSGHNFNPDLYETKTEMEVIRTSISWKGIPLTSPVLSARLEVRGRIISAVVNPRPNSNYCNLIPVQSLFAQSDIGMIGEATLDQPWPPGKSAWCLEVSTTKSREVEHKVTEFDHNVLLLLPTNKPMEFKRLGVGIIWHRTVLRDETKGAVNYGVVEKSTIVLV